MTIIYSTLGALVFLYFGIFFYTFRSCPIFSIGWGSEGGFFFEWEPKKLECTTLQTILMNLIMITIGAFLVLYLLFYLIERYKEKLTDNIKEVSS